MKDHILDDKDIDILRILISDCRTSYRNIGLSIGLSTNTIKARIKSLVFSGVITKFITSIDLSVFGYSKICYLLFRKSKVVKETMNRLKLIGQPIVEVEAIGGRSMLAIAIRKGNEEKIQLLTEALKPILIQKLLVAQSATLRLKLRRIDFEILKCLLSDPRMRINDISKIVSVSSKTVSSRLAKLKENRIVMFNVGTNPTKMKGYTRFGMVIWLENDIDKKDIREIHKILENSFVIALLMISQEEVLNYQIVARSIFEIDPILSKLESLAGVRSAEAIIPFKARIHQDWIFQEIENIANNDHKDR